MCFKWKYMFFFFLNCLVLNYNLILIFFVLRFMKTNSINFIFFSNFLKILCFTFINTNIWVYLQYFNFFFIKQFLLFFQNISLKNIYAFPLHNDYFILKIFYFPFLHKCIVNNENKQNNLFLLMNIWKFKTFLWSQYLQHILNKFNIFILINFLPTEKFKFFNNFSQLGFVLTGFNHIFAKQTNFDYPIYYLKFNDYVITIFFFLFLNYILIYSQNNIKNYILYFYKLKQFFKIFCKNKFLT